MRKQKSEVNQNGSVLLVVLLLVTILTSLAVEFAYEVYISTSALSNYQNAQKASLLSKSGHALGLTYIKSLQGLTSTSIKEKEIPVEGKIKEGFLSIAVIDENSKLNVNKIATDDNALTSLKKLLEYLKINPSLALYIADYIDTDKEPRIFAAEDNAKNSNLWSIEELNSVKGIDKETFETIKPYITVYGSNININTAELPVLISLHTEMTESLAKKIIYQRESAPFKDKAKIVNISGLEIIGANILNRIDVKSSDFRIISKAVVNDINRIIESVIDTSMNIKYWSEG
ncbi:MAG: type II secretion system minor pseudopilin GspK [Nitrospirae bacterium]|nr:type II secretion system minor pseudopilin GspK [Nitrospirota bacterium]